jgi:hypothetical protein
MDDTDGIDTGVDDGAVQRAIDNGDPAGVQYKRYLEAAERCYNAADKIKGLKPKVDAFERCQAIFAKAQFILANMDAIDRGQGIPSASDIDNFKRQADADKRYDQVYTQYRNKSRDEIQRAHDQVAG